MVVVDGSGFLIESSDHLDLLSGELLDPRLVKQVIDVVAGAQDPFAAAPDTSPGARRGVGAQGPFLDHLRVGAAQ